jgi:hypothetical protein
MFNLHGITRFRIHATQGSRLSVNTAYPEKAQRKLARIRVSIYSFLNLIKEDYPGLLAKQTAGIAKLLAVSPLLALF